MQIVNDNRCSWINDLVPRSNIKILEKNEELNLKFKFKVLLSESLLETHI